jgi:hypothetical protein
MASFSKVCQELGIDPAFANFEFGYEEVPSEKIHLFSYQIESLANAWAEKTGDEFEVSDNDVFKVDLNQLAADLDICENIVFQEVYKAFGHTVYDGDHFYAYLYEHEVQELCDILAEKHGLDFTGELA